MLASTIAVTQMATTFSSILTNSVGAEDIKESLDQKMAKMTTM